MLRVDDVINNKQELLPFGGAMKTQQLLLRTRGTIKTTPAIATTGWKTALRSRSKREDTLLHTNNHPQSNKTRGGRYRTCRIRFRRGIALQQHQIDPLPDQENEQ